MRYQVEARVLYNNEKGWESSGRGCPTFWVSAVSHENAADIAADILNPYYIPEYKLTLTVMETGADKVEIKIFRHVNRELKPWRLGNG